MNLLFAADSPWVWDAEKNFAILKEENPELVQAARRAEGVSTSVDIEYGAPGSRKASLVAGGRRPSLATTSETKKVAEKTHSRL